MEQPIRRRKRPNYGVDAPAVVRNLSLAGAAGVATWIGRYLGLWSDESTLAPLGYGVGGLGVLCLLVAGVRLWASRFGKLRWREAFLNAMPWRGDETVLDVGCGRGLLLIGAAKRLTTGKPIGVDIWQG